MMETSTGFRFKRHEIGVFATKSSDVAIASLEKGAAVSGLTMGEFSLIDLIRSTLSKTGPAHVVVATWSAGIKDVHQVRWMMDTELVKSFRLLLDRSYATRQKRYAATVEEIFGIENIQTSDIHAKFVLIWNDEFTVTIVSSMNLNANRTCETFTVSEGCGMFAMFKGFVDHHFTEPPMSISDSADGARKRLAEFFKKYDSTVGTVVESRRHWGDE